MIFSTCKLSDIANVQTGPFGSQLHNEDYVSRGTPIVTVEHLGHKKFTLQNLPFVSEKDKQRLNKYMLQRGDIVFSRVGSVDRCSFVSEREQGWLFSGRCLRVRITKASVLPEYLYYYFCQSEIKEQIRNIAVGATMPSINTSLLSELYFVYPSEQFQKKITSILSTIDDKIEHNARINHNLEEQAKAIFKSWFIDFSAIGDTPILNVDDFLCPQGWSISSLAEIATYLNDLAMQKYRPSETDPGYPVLKIKELRQGMCDQDSERCSSEIKPEYIIHDGDVIFSWSGSLLVDFWCGGDCGLNQHLFKVTSENFDKWFFYSWTRHYLNEFVAIAADKATTMGHIKRENLQAAKILVPPKATYKKIGLLLAPIYDAIIQNRIESKSLAQFRDTLLPKLMSGEIDVSKVEV